MSSWRLTIITHTDLDGVGAAAAYLRLGGFVMGVDARVFFTEPYNLHRVLEQEARDPGERIAVMDLGPNAATMDVLKGLVEKIASQGARIEWYDHHRWEPGWLEELGSAGARLHVDTSTCATGVVAKYAPIELGVSDDPFVEELARAVCAADLWRWDHPLAPRLYRVAERFHGSRGDEWRRRMMKGFVEGSLWWPELDEALHEYLRREFEGFSYSLRHLMVFEAKGCKVVVALRRPGPPSPSIIGNSLLSRLGADVVGIVKSNGNGISLRSLGVDVRRIAVAMGGGGHPRAAGAPLNMNLLWRILSKLYPRLKLRYASRRLREAIEGLGGCPELGDT